MPKSWAASLMTGAGTKNGSMILDWFVDDFGELHFIGHLTFDALIARTYWFDGYL